jgi:hypothetical protein
MGGCWASNLKSQISNFKKREEEEMSGERRAESGGLLV